jgi:hypothetical protein
MISYDNHLSRSMLVLLPVAIVALGFGLSMVPSCIVLHWLKILTAWLTVSVPLAVVVGHCMLNEPS